MNFRHKRLSVIILLSGCPIGEKTEATLAAQTAHCKWELVALKAQSAGKQLTQGHRNHGKRDSNRNAKKAPFQALYELINVEKVSDNTYLLLSCCPPT
jgi:hypothetical protein